MRERPPVLTAALVGFGNIAQVHLAEYTQMAGVRIAAVVDPSVEARHRAAILLPGAKTYPSLEDLAADSAVDFVDICSPPFAHMEHIRTALMMDADILCEKPVFLTPDDYKSIETLLLDSDNVLMPCHDYRFSPALQAMKHVMETDEFGAVLVGNFRTWRRGHSAGIATWRPDWRRDSKLAGGGILQDHGTHGVYLAAFLLDEWPIEVSCVTGSLERETGYDTEDTAFMTLWFPSGARFDVDLTWSAGQRQTTYSVFGERQALFLDDDRFIYSGATRDRPQVLDAGVRDSTHARWFRPLFLDFLNAVSLRDRRFNLYMEAKNTSDVVASAYESAKCEGERLAVSRKRGWVLWGSRCGPRKLEMMTHAVQQAQAVIALATTSRHRHLPGQWSTACLLREA